MMKALIKKQILEMLSFLSGSGRGKKRRSKGGLALYALLLVYVVAVFGFLFYQMMGVLCTPLINSGLSWLYFALAGTMATALGVFGSVFAAQSQLYEAKDNELLLSLPIPPGRILLARMLVLYAQTLIFEATVLIPCILVYQNTEGTPPLGIVFFLMVSFAAVTSSVSVMEAIVSSMMDKFHVSRKKGTILTTLYGMIVGVIVCLGYNKLYFELKLPNGTVAQILDVMDYISNNCLMPMVALLTCILIGWVVKPKVIIDEVTLGGYRFGREKLYVAMIKVIAPLMLLILLVQSVGL